MQPRKSISEIAAHRGIVLEAAIVHELYLARQEGLREGVLTCIEYSLEQKFGSEGIDFMPQVHALERVEDLRRFYYGLVRAGCLRDAVRYLPHLPAEVA
jgi:hypothetical protein